ncbi:MAG: hypothetical protein WBB74_06690 [Gaiellaceae bacterium]
MGIALAVVFLVVIGPVALLYGADSHARDPRDRRPWWPGTR